MLIKLTYLALIQIGMGGGGWVLVNERLFLEFIGKVMQSKALHG